jgi:hypothetical protein
LSICAYVCMHSAPVETGKTRLVPPSGHTDEHDSRQSRTGMPVQRGGTAITPMRGSGSGAGFGDAITALTRRRIEIFDGAGGDWRFAESLIPSVRTRPRSTRAARSWSSSRTDTTPWPRGAHGREAVRGEFLEHGIRGLGRHRQRQRGDVLDHSGREGRVVESVPRPGPPP